MALACAALVVASAGGAGATITVYSSQASFDSAYPSASLVDFSSLTPSDNPIPNSTLTLDGDTFRSSDPLFLLFGCCGTGDYGVNFLSAQIVGSGGDSLEILTPPLSAIGLTYGNYFFPPEPITVILSNGSQVIAPSADDLGDFIGLSSTTPIYGLILSTYAVPDYPMGATLDLLSVEQVAAPPVPEPAGWALMLVGVSLAGARLRWRHPPGVTRSRAR
jgi:hypothetical protein